MLYRQIRGELPQPALNGLSTWAMKKNLGVFRLHIRHYFLPSYMGTLISHYKDPFFKQPAWWNVIYIFFSWLTCFYCFPTNYSTQPSSRASSDRLSRGSQQMGCAKRGPPRQPWWTVRESQRSKPDGWRKVKLSGKDRKPMGTAVHVIMVLYIKKICNMHIYKQYIICVNQVYEDIDCFACHSLSLLSTSCRGKLYGCKPQTTSNSFVGNQNFGS